MADSLLDETLWPGQPLGRDVAGLEETVRGITRDVALDYLHDQYVPNNTVVSIAGAVAHDEVMAQAEQVFGDWSRGVPRGWFPAVNGQQAPRAAVKYKSTEQAHLSVAVRGPPMHHPDRYSLSLLSVILGERLTAAPLELRERRGLCYDVHSYCSYFLDAGAFTLYAGVDPSKTEEALRALLAELGKLRAEGVPEDELQRAKALAKGRILLRMEDHARVRLAGRPGAALRAHPHRRRCHRADRRCHEREYAASRASTHRERPAQPGYRRAVSFAEALRAAATPVGRR